MRKISNMPKSYNINDKNSILQYATSLVGNTLRDILSNQVVNEIESTTLNLANKGRFGNKLEKYFFQYEPNSEKEPDFPCGLELKVTPLKILKSGRISIKERLVCNIINYMEIVNETFITSSFLFSSVRAVCSEMWSWWCSRHHLSEKKAFSSFDVSTSI